MLPDEPSGNKLARILTQAINNFPPVDTKSTAKTAKTPANQQNPNKLAKTHRLAEIFAVKSLSYRGMPCLHRFNRSY